MTVKMTVFELIDKQVNMIHSSTLSKRLTEKIATYRSNLSDNCTYEHQQIHYVGWRISHIMIVLSCVEETEVITRIIT